MGVKHHILDCGGRPLDLSSPRLMGIVNVTPDSFSDGGRYLAPERAVRQGRRLAREGAAIVDVGGESTRPGAARVSAEAELERVLPVIEALVGALSIPVSVDTSKPAVMRAAARAGAGLINDVRALTEPDALDAAAETGLPVCLMHMQGEPRSMQRAPRYDDVVDDLLGFFEARIRACEDVGIARGRLLLDPGFGFGKTLEHNLALLAGLNRFTRLGLPLLVGLSRKSMFQQLLGRRLNQRLPGSIAAGLLAVERGASVLRVHDVRAHADALAVLRAIG